MNKYRLSFVVKEKAHYNQIFHTAKYGDTINEGDVPDLIEYINMVFEKDYDLDVRYIFNASYDLDDSTYLYIRLVK